MLISLTTFKLTSDKNKNAQLQCMGVNQVLGNYTVVL